MPLRKVLGKRYVEKNVIFAAKKNWEKENKKLCHLPLSRQGDSCRRGGKGRENNRMR